jgi:dihydrofolate reductase
MANLIYSAIASLDGFTVDGNGDFDWAAPDEEVHAFVNDNEPDTVRRLKRAARQDATVGGPALAAHALAAGLVDECHLFLNPVVVGGGTRALPAGLHLELELLDERRFGNGVVFLRYRVG